MQKNFYKVVTFQNGNESVVEEMMEDNWKLKGSPVLLEHNKKSGTLLFYQVLTKYKYTESDFPGRSRRY